MVKKAVLASALVGAMTLAGCAGGSATRPTSGSSPTSGSVSKGGGTLTIASASPPNSMNPSQGDFDTSRAILAATVEEDLPELERAVRALFVVVSEE